jgi:formylglycine-generating enzyme required for sulfatase activity
MLDFVAAVAAAIAAVAPVMKNLGEIAKGGRHMLEFADNILARFARKGSNGQQQAELRQALARVAAMPQVEFDKKAEEIIDVELADQPPEYRKAVTEYIKLIPPRIRASFSRPEDPTGTTVPAKWSATRPEDIVPFLPPRPPMFREGDSPPEANRWILTERLGIGGFGEVWKARSKTMQNSYSAFKFCLDPVSQQRIFENELENIELVKNELIDHPNVVKLIDAYLEGDSPWLQYEYIPGGDLGQLVGTWPNDLAVRATLAVKNIGILADTLAHCHNELSRKVIHRDMKPANVLVGKNGTLKITDFGISDTQARQALAEARMASVSGVSYTTPSLVRWANTPMYASPQQRRGEDSHPSDDVHALGVMLYQMLLRDLNLELGVDMWSDLEEQYVCQELLDLLSRAVAARVDRRFPSAAELAEALARLPKRLIVESVVVSVTDQKKQLYEEIDRLVDDARAKNEAARQHLERREWKAAVATLETIFHPVMRDEDLYTRAVHHRDGKRFINDLGMEFAIVPGGTFWMGGLDGKCGDNQVTIDRDFYIGVYPVTQEEWQNVMGANPSYFRKGGGGADKLSGVSDADLKRFPVESVSWNDCQVFIKKLNEGQKETGWMYRLPREAEWEYACRGAATTQALCAWNFYLRAPTNTLSAQQANFSESALGRTCRVGLYEANTLGLFDMHGNVWEWCEDAYDGSNRVLRGGSWNYAAEFCRAVYRSAYAPTNASSYMGLRLARVPSGK